MVQSKFGGTPVQAPQGVTSKFGGVPVDTPMPTPAPVIAAAQNADVLGGIMQRRPDGQLVIPAREQTQPSLSTQSIPAFIGTNLINNAEDLARPLAGGVRNMVAGVVGIPADIAESLGGSRSPTIDALIQNLPVVEQNGLGGEIGQAVTQYAPAAMTAASLVPSASRNAPAFVKGVANAAKVAAASLADMLVTDPNQAATVGDLLNMGPTNIQEGDTSLAKRIKTGAETAIVEPVVNLARGAGGAIGKFIDVNKARTDPVRQRQLAEQLVMRSALDPEKAAQDIAATRASVDPTDTFKPTGPEASKDIGLLQLQRGVANDPRMVERQQANMESTINTFEQGAARTDPTGANFPSITKTAENAAQQQLAPVQADLAQAQQRGAQIDKRIQTQAEQLDAQRAAGPSASEQIAEADRAARQKVTQTKNELYDTTRVDPEGRLVADSTNFLAQVDNIKEKPGAVDSGLPANIKVELERVRPQTPDTPHVDIVDGETGRVLNPKEPTTMSFEYLSNLRSSISNAIADARAANKGARVDTLTQLKNIVNQQIEDFANAADPAAREAAGRLSEANQYFKETASPLLREGVGGKLTKAEQAGRPVPDTEVGRAYLGRGAAPRERVADFNRMLAQVDDPKAVETAARDWLVSDLARTIDGKLTPERVDRWMKNKDIAEILDGRPDVKKEVGQMLNRIRAKSGVKKRIEQEILDKTAAVQRTQKEINQSALGAFLPPTKEGASPDPYEAVASILRSKTNVRQKMRQIAAAAKEDSTGEALEGLRDAVRLYIKEKAMPTRGATQLTLETASDKIDFKQLKQAMSDNEIRGVLEDLYGAQSKEMRNFDKVLKEIEISTRPERVAGTTNSSTKPIEENIRRTGTTLAQIMGQNFRQSRILNLAVSYLPDNSQEAVKQFMIDIILDPKMSETLMLRQTEENIPKIEKALRTYISNNVAGADEDSRKENQKGDNIPQAQGAQ